MAKTSEDDEMAPRKEVVSESHLKRIESIDQPKHTLAQREASIIPASQLLPSRADERISYQRFIAVRKTIIGLIDQDNKNESVLDDVADALLEKDIEFPTGIHGFVKTIFTLGKNVREKRILRGKYKEAMNCILQQIFDPQLQFKMTAKDIRDACEANGVPREKITFDSIGIIYVKVLNRIKTGPLRNAQLEEDISGYMALKLEEIRLSRAEWELSR